MPENKGMSEEEKKHWEGFRCRLVFNPIPIYPVRSDANRKAEEVVQMTRCRAKELLAEELGWPVECVPDGFTLFYGCVSAFATWELDGDCVAAVGKCERPQELNIQAVQELARREGKMTPKALFENLAAEVEALKKELFLVKFGGGGD